MRIFGELGWVKPDLYQLKIVLMGRQLTVRKSIKYMFMTINDSWEQWVTVEEWCGESAQVRRSKL